MKDWLIFISEHAIVLVDWLALIVILFGTAEVVLNLVRLAFDGSSEWKYRIVWLRYARWLVAGLTFQLAADIVETSITTEWEAVGRIAAVAVIRTFLNYFLERDLTEVRERNREAKAE